jgi:polysaccharide biosynthesis protein PslH
VRLSWVTEEVPDRSGASGGGGIRQAHLLLALGARFDVELVVAGRLVDDAVRAAVAAVHEVDAPAVSPRRVAVALGRRATLETTSSCRQRAALGAALPVADVVVLHHHALAPLLARRRAGERWLLHQFHVPAVEAAAVAGSWLLRRNAANTARLQRWAADRADAIVAVSDDDAALLGGRRHVVVPNGVDPELRASPVPGERRVVVTGSLDFPPNVDGVRWLVTEVWPAVRARVPDAVLDVVGRRPVPSVVALGGEGVRVLADVASAVEHLRGARVAAVPVRFGSGTRIKTLEALAAGRPVVSTSVGVAGLGATPALVRDDPDSFAAAVVDVLTDDELARRLGAAGPAAAPRWPGIGAAFADWLEQLR